MVLVENGKISKVSKNIEIPQGIEIIDAEGVFMLKFFRMILHHTPRDHESDSTLGFFTLGPGEEVDCWDDAITLNLQLCVFV